MFFYINYLNVFKFAFYTSAIRPDEIESAKKHGSPLELLIPKSEEEEEEEIIPVVQQVALQTSQNYEESSVSYSESYSVETSVMSPTTPNKYCINYKVIIQLLNNNDNVCDYSV